MQRRYKYPLLCVITCNFLIHVISHCYYRHLVGKEDLFLLVPRASVVAWLFVYGLSPPQKWVKQPNIILGSDKQSTTSRRNAKQHDKFAPNLKSSITCCRAECYKQYKNAKLLHLFCGLNLIRRRSFNLSSIIFFRNCSLFHFLVLSVKA